VNRATSVPPYDADHATVDKVYVVDGEALGDHRTRLDRSAAEKVIKPGPARAQEHADTIDDW
jgi:hypothetical protein